jgi:uroporphyrinogen-III synthase
MPTDDKADLDQATILLTRPRDQALALSDLFETAGARVIHFPVIEIVPLALSDEADEETVRHIIEQLDSYAIAIFISSNAVIQADRIVRRIKGQWPGHLRLAVIGPASAQALTAIGLQAEICPTGDYNSEGLLATATLQHLEGKRVIIFRGKGGRETLAAELRRRGAHVDYAEVYQRRRPAIRLADLSQRQRDAINAIIVASNESLQNLYDMADDGSRSWLLGVPLVVISQRSGALAEELGFKRVVIAEQATNQGMFNATLACLDFQMPESRNDRGTE